MCAKLILTPSSHAPSLYTMPSLILEICTASPDAHKKYESLQMF